MEAKYAKILWDYHHMNQVLQVAECILALGSHDVHVAERASELFLEGLQKKYGKSQKLRSLEILQLAVGFLKRTY